MSRKITLSDLEPVEVDLFGKAYTVNGVTRSVQKALEEVDRKLQAVAGQDDDDSDAIVGLLAEGMDALLKPATAKVPPALQTITTAWEQDKLTLGQLNNLYDSVQEAAAEKRPT